MAKENVDIPISNETLLIISITGLTLIITTLYVLFFRGKSGLGSTAGDPNGIRRVENRAQRKARQREERRLERIRQQEAELLDAAEDRMDEAQRLVDEHEDDNDNHDDNSVHSYDPAENDDDDDGTIAGDDHHTQSTGGHRGRNRRLEQKRAEKQARKEELRRMEAQRREELQSKRQAEDEAYAEWLRQKRVDDAIEREEFQREQAKKEQERLEKLRHMREDDVNSVYEKLTNEIAMEMAAYIVRCKVVKLQDLLVKFRIRYTDIAKHISKLNEHVESGTMLLSRDVVIYVNQEEMTAVADYIKGAGRATTFSELASICSEQRIIDCKSTLSQYNVDNDESIRNSLQLSD